MVVDLYKNEYVVPAKCGSRYFWKTVDYWGEPQRIFFKDIMDNKVEFKHIVVRNPLSHLKSGLQTEVMECFDDPVWIKKILLSFTDTNFGGAHFHPRLCQNIYKMKSTGGFKINVVDLSNLTEFMKNELFEIPYDETEFDFHWDSRYVSKETVWERCYSLYPEIMDVLVEFAEIDTNYYNRLLNKDESLSKLI